MPLPEPTPAELDNVLADYDQTRAEIKRRLVAKITLKLIANEDLVKAQGLLIDNMRAGRAPSRELLDKIRELKEALR